MLLGIGCGVGSLFGQVAPSPSVQDYAHIQTLNFDKVLSGTDKMITIAPPPGKIWVIVAGAFQTDRPLPYAWIAVWKDHAPYAPYRDPVTGEELGCARCVTLIHADARYTFVPLVGGYLKDADGTLLIGQTAPIVIAYPNRLMIAVTPPHGGLDAPLPTYTAVEVIERDIR